MPGHLSLPTARYLARLGIPGHGLPMPARVGVGVLGGLVIAGAAGSGGVASGRYRLELVDDLQNDVELAVLAVEASRPGHTGLARAAARAHIKRDPTTPQRDADGELTLAGRRCCFKAAVQIEARIDQMPMPAEWTCTCGARWRAVLAFARSAS